MPTYNNRTKDMTTLISNVFNQLYSVYDLEWERSNFKRRFQTRNRLARKLGFTALYEIPEVTSYWVFPSAKKKGGL